MWVLQRQILWERSCSWEHSILPSEAASQSTCSSFALHFPALCGAPHDGPLLTAVFLFKQLEKLKEQLSAEDGSEVAYALESLSASQPKKRGKF